MKISESIHQLAQAGTDAEKIFLLKKIIDIADSAYYLEDNPLLADKEYDDFYKQLIHLENEHPELKTADSPTQRVSGGLNEQFASVPHLVPMLSLENSYNSDDLVAWDVRNRKALGRENIVYTVEPKFDGASISLIYSDDALWRGATRGDGVMGDDITQNVRQIRSVPLSLAMSDDGVQSLEVRGEVMIRKNTFAQLNEDRVKEGQNILANPRNAASGSLRMQDPEEVRKRKLFAMLYHISFVTKNDKTEYEHLPFLAGHYESIEWLHAKGLATPIHDIKKCNGIDEVVAACSEIERLRDEYPYELDGAVVKVNAFADQERLGMTSHHPRWAMAFKFKARQATSRLLQVAYQVGRTGVVTPVAKIEPVGIGGVVISSISLFNEDIIREKDLKIGDRILVERAGDVIPYIVKSIAEERTGDEVDVIFPTKCPVCDEPLYKEEGEVAWRCVNIQCGAQVLERIIHFASKDAMDIRSLGPSIIARLHELQLLKDIAGIYTLDYEAVGRLDKFGEKSVSRLKEAVEKSKNQPLNRLIFGLGIRFVGERTAKTLSASVQSSIMELKDKSIEELSMLEDIGIKVATSVYDFFRSEENIHLIEKLGNAGVAIQKTSESAASSADGFLSGKTFLFTGTLSELKRSEAEAMVEEHGGQILGSVSSKLQYLVVGTDAGSKLEKAKKLGTVSILTEKEFLQMIARQ